MLWNHLIWIVLKPVVNVWPIVNIAYFKCRVRIVKMTAHFVVSFVLNLVRRHYNF